MSDGHSDVGAGEERDIDFGNKTDDGEVELNLPREDAMEQDPPGEDVRDLPGSTASGASVTNQQERYRLEPLNGAQPKWTHPGLPLPVIEEHHSPGSGATVDMYGPGMNWGGMRVPTQCRGGDAHEYGRRQTWGLPGPGGTAAWQGYTISFSCFC